MKRSIITPILLMIVGLRADAALPPISLDFTQACLSAEEIVVYFFKELPSDIVRAYRTSPPYPAVKERHREF